MGKRCWWRSSRHQTQGSVSAVAAITAAAISVTGATGVAAQTADWTASRGDGMSGVRTMSTDGTVELNGGCKRFLVLVFM